MPGTTDKGAATPAARMTQPEVLQALSGLMAGMFVAILASTSVYNALPRMMADLGGSQSSYPWIVTVELLAMTVTVPLWGKMADLYSQKLLVQAALVLFVVGSLVAGASTGVEMLIVSRIIQGVGAGGVTALVRIIMASMIPPRELGRYSGVFGGIFAVATVAGPLVGGVLVDTPWLGWRWCFFIGVPFSVVAIVLLQKTLRLATARRQVRIDYLGAFLIIAGVSTILVWSTLAGASFAWASGWTAALVATGLGLLALAVLVESRAEEPIIPLRVFANRTVTLAILASVFVGIALFGGTVFLSQYFQLSLGLSPTVAGLMSLPLIVGLLASSIVSGALITRTGRWKVFLVTGAAISPVAVGLLSTIDTDTPEVLIVGYLTLLGTGVGMLMQNLVLAAQNEVAATDLGTTTSVLSFFRSLGGAVGVSALGAVLANRITSLTADRLGTPAGSGAATVPDLSQLPPDVGAVVQDVYGVATGELFLVVTPVAVLALVAVMFIREKPLKTTSGRERLAAERAAAAAATDGRVDGIDGERRGSAGRGGDRRG